MIYKLVFQPVLSTSAIINIFNYLFIVHDPLVCTYIYANPVNPIPPLVILDFECLTGAEKAMGGEPEMNLF